MDVTRDGSLVLGSCHCVRCSVDITLRAAPGAWFRAELHLGDDLWISNLSLDAELWLVDLENPELRVRAPAGHRRLVVPFEFSEASFHVGGCAVSERLTLFGPEQTEQVRSMPCDESVSSIKRLRLGKGTIGAAVLDELCARTAETGRPASSIDIAEGLGHRGVALTAKGVDRHLDHLFRRCFPEDTSRARGWKRMALVSLVRRSRVAP
ncbi:hypothetical protein N802_15645 [Knoellia sinensis KCTC 19936]|uniref:Uncharacterized protein n=1 Tax=Knoellia sinensis KCTC 19936 TaxID=1385520 RepID=A0A0A0J8H4_9MICO|nr:hypothetical protein N802_15645 [Knoellia sinensis KCTC 19936]